MATYRLAEAADVPVIVAFFNPVAGQTRPYDSVKNMGYFEVEPFTASGLLRDLDRPREKWALAFDNAGKLRGFLQLVFSKMGDRVCWWGHFGLDPNISLASIRTHRNTIAKLLVGLIPDGFTLIVPFVSPSATIANEWLAAKMGAPEKMENGRLLYAVPIETLRLVA